MTLLDDADLPIFRINFSSEVSTEELERAAAGMQEVFTRGQRVVCIIDISRLELAFTVERRKHLQQMMATIQRDADRLMIAVFYVASNVVARGVVTSLNWSRGKRPYPVRVVSTVAEAEAAAKELL